jgi:hypothetical protein
MRRAPRGMVDAADGPTAAIRPSRTSTVASRSTESRVIVTTVAPVMATTPGRALYGRAWGARLRAVQARR